MYKIRCYTKHGDFDHEEYFETLEGAKERRTKWGLNIGLKPEPSSDFPYYPTIWEGDAKGFKRVEGY